MVDLVVEEPHGAYPTGCTGCYDADEAHLAAYLRQAKAGDEQCYLDEVVRGHRRQADVARPEGSVTATNGYTRAEAVVSAMARRIEDGMVIATGVASHLPILAIATAKATHAPRLSYLACVGSLDPRMDRLRPSAESVAYLDGRSGEITIPDLFDHARRGRIDVMFFGAAEVDEVGDTNLSAAGSLERPVLQIPGRRRRRHPQALGPRPRPGDHSPEPAQPGPQGAGGVDQRSRSAHASLHGSRRLRARSPRGDPRRPPPLGRSRMRSRNGPASTTTPPIHCRSPKLRARITWRRSAPLIPTGCANA